MISAVAARRAKLDSENVREPAEISLHNAAPMTSSADPEGRDPVATHVKRKRSHKPEKVPSGDSNFYLSTNQKTGPTIPSTGRSSSPSPQLKRTRRVWSPSHPSGIAGQDAEDEDSESDVGEPSFTAEPTMGDPSRSQVPVDLVLPAVFQPILGDNLITCQNASGVYLLLRPGESFPFRGLAFLSVVVGNAELLGVRLSSSSAKVPVFAPKSAPSPVVRALIAEEQQDREPLVSSLPQEVMAKFSSGVTVIKLEPLASTGVEGLGRIVASFSGDFSGDPAFPSLGSGGYSILQEQDLGQCFQYPEAWKYAVDSIVNAAPATSAPSRILVKGPKKSGKSTFCRVLLNNLLRKYRSVAFLDCDLGQPEFSPPGLISLHLVSELIFGPPYARVRPAYTSHYVGTSTPRSDPASYISAITAAFQTYRLDLQYNASEIAGTTSASTNSQERLSFTPLVVNTQGWNRGMGADILRVIAELIGPTHIVELDAFSAGLDSDTTSGRVGFDRVRHTEVPGLATWADDALSVTEPYAPSAESDIFTVPAFSSSSAHNSPQPADLRALQTMSYFHSKPLGAGLPSWNTDQSLVETRPYEVDISSAFDAIILRGPGSEDVSPQEVLTVLNGALVALVETEDQSSSYRPKEAGPGAAQGVPYTPGILPPDPSTSRCLGLAFVRAVTHEPARLHILTPMPPEDIQRCRVLVKGELEIPLWAFLGSSASSNEWRGAGGTVGGTVLGTPWSSTPFLYFRGEREKIVGSEVKRSRKNVMRRGQM